MVDDNVDSQCLDDEGCDVDPKNGDDVVSPTIKRLVYTLKDGRGLSAGATLFDWLVECIVKLVLVIEKVPKPMRNK